MIRSHSQIFVRNSVLKYFDKKTFNQISESGTRPSQLAPAASLRVLSEVVTVDVSGRHFEKVGNWVCRKMLTI